MPRTPSGKYLQAKELYPAFLDAVQALGNAIKKAEPIGEYLMHSALAATVRSAGEVDSQPKTGAGRLCARRRNSPSNYIVDQYHRFSPRGS